MLCVNFATKYYKNSMALEKVYLTVNPGEIVGIFGPNGAGKTTLLKAIMNLIQLNAGEVTVNGKSVQGENYKCLAYITEEGSFFPDLTPREHADFYKHMLDAFDEARFHKMLTFFSLPLDKKACTFSRGQKAKLEVAIGFSRGARYILMDEPFLGNDVFTRRDFMKLMITCMKEEESIIIATHLIDEIENVLSRAVILKEGRKVCDVAMEELQEQGQSLYELMKYWMEYKEDRVKDLVE